MHENCKLFTQVQELEANLEKKNFELMEAKHELKQLSEQNQV